MSKLVRRIVGFVVRHPRLTAGIWILLVAGLGMHGRDLEQKLSIHPLFVDGSDSKRAHEIAEQEFGNAYTVVVGLHGPPADVERQGRELAARLGAVPHTEVVSPWARGAEVEGLRPDPEVAALVVTVRGKEIGKASGLLPPLRRRVDATVAGPVHASLAGFPVIVESVRRSGTQASTAGELIAVPILLFVLLFVFRSVVAALLPIVIGGAVVGATRGILSLLLGVFPLDLFAAGIVGMMGLALGVDYSLLVISRFREERQNGTGLNDAVEEAVAGTARSVIPAGCGLILAMVVAMLVLGGAIAVSVSLAVIMATILSVLSAICVVPALLMLLGDNLERWSLPQRRKSQVSPLRWSRRLGSNPRAIVAITFVLVLLAGWAFTLDSGTASVALLPPGDPGRIQQEEVEDELGPGWTAPIEVIMDGRGSPVTSTERLQALVSFQRKAERDPGVATVAGLARIARVGKQLNGLDETLASQERGLDRLETGISKIHGGAQQNTSGLLKAAAVSRQLESGIGAAHKGGGALAGALDATSAGSKQLSAGLGQAGEGSEKLAQGTTKASSGAGQLADGLNQAQEKTGNLVGTARLLKNAMRSGEERLGEVDGRLGASEEQLAAAWQALERMTSGRSDPEYAAAVRAVQEANRNLSGTDLRTGEQPDPSFQGADEGVERADGEFGVGLYLAEGLGENGREATKGLKKLARGSERLDRGLQRLAGGSRQISTGIERLAQGGEKLSPALQQLSDGADKLAGGLGKLETGANQFASGLGEGAEKSKLLGGALGRVESGLESQRADGGQTGQLSQRSPGLFDSSYFVLAGLDGSRPAQRRQVAFLVNINRGGQDARMLVIPKDPSTSEAAEATKDRLEVDAASLARKTGTEVVIGGVTPANLEMNDSLRESSLLMRLVLALVTLLVLIPVLRSLLIPVIAAAINLVTVSAAFGVLSLLFNGSLLGGPGFVDTAIIPGTVMVMFGLAIDYEVFVFARIREEYLRTGSTKAAVTNGLDRTAHVVTGAAMIMIVVFLAFSASEYMSIRNFGVAQAAAVFIDAFIVRLIIMPAVMIKLGKWCWWMPRWLDRLLPGGSPPPARAGGDAQEAPA